MENELLTIEQRENMRVATPFYVCTGGLIVLKCLGFISWPWIWVFSPIWFPIAAIIGVCTAAIMLFMLLMIILFLIFN